MVISSRHADKIFNLIDRLSITSGAVGFWRDSNEIIRTINCYLDLNDIDFNISNTKVNYNTGVITYAWIEKKKPFILNIPYKEGEVI